MPAVALGTGTSTRPRLGRRARRAAPVAVARGRGAERGGGRRSGGGGGRGRGSEPGAHDQAPTNTPVSASAALIDRSNAVTRSGRESAVNRGLARAQPWAQPRTCRCRPRQPRDCSVQAPRSPGHDAHRPHRAGRARRTGRPAFTRRVDPRGPAGRRAAPGTRPHGRRRRRRAAGSTSPPGTASNRRRSPATAAPPEVGVCRALGWTPDSIDRILIGGEPDRRTRRPATVVHVTRGRPGPAPTGVDARPRRRSRTRSARPASPWPSGVAIEVLAVLVFFLTCLRPAGATLPRDTSDQPARATNSRSSTLPTSLRGSASRISKRAGTL